MHSLLVRATIFSASNNFARMLPRYTLNTRLLPLGMRYRRSNLRHCSVRHAKFTDQQRFSQLNVQTSENASRAIKAAHMLNPGEFPLLNKTIGQLLSEAAAEWPERVCVISINQNIRLTFSDLLRRVDALAAGFKKLGLKKGDRLGIWGPNDVEWFIASLSASRAGLIVVAINPAYQQNELMYSLRKVDVKAIVSPASFKTQNYPKMLLAARETCPNLQHIIIYSEDHIPGTHRLIDVESSATRAEVQAIAATQDEISCYDGCNIQFTSGSTGTAKATLISHRALVNNSKEGLRRLRAGIDDKICLNVPFFHAFGLIMGQTFVLHAGNTLVLEGRSFDPVKSLEAIAAEKCAVTYGTPTMWVNLLDAQQRLQLPTTDLRIGITGGAPASPEIFRRIENTFALDMTSIYGLTETTGIIFQTVRGLDGRLVESTVGQLSDHVEAMIVDESGLPVSFGTPGELWIRGYCTMMGYWNDQAITTSALTEDGWLKTGDRFVLHENGYGNIVGRLKDMIIRGGENIFPKEIEDFLMTHPQVLNSQVIGAYDGVYGEEVCACIQLRDGARLTENELREYCRGKIAHFKIPRYIEFVDGYPMTASGKIQKFRLKERMEEKGAIPSNSN